MSTTKRKYVTVRLPDDMMAKLKGHIHTRTQKQTQKQKQTHSCRRYGVEWQVES